MMIPQTSYSEFPARVPQGWRFDLVEIATIAIGVVMVTALTMMF
ncbi:MAG TPA: hypothetical protein VHU22_25260 [Xanthobacteraceae bacterium]|jgi:hypothetical protein|nr:hypothetical protein [Xanthobacteraceae bacterium]